MLYNIKDINFWNSINIDHIDLLLENINDLYLKNKLEAFRNDFLELINNIEDDNFLYQNIKTHTQFINDITDMKNVYLNQDYSLGHMINEGICGYRILLIIEQNAYPIPIIENIRIQEMLLPASIEHLKLMNKLTDSDNAKKINRYYQKMIKLKEKQNKVYLHFSQYGKVNKILKFNKQILKSSKKLITFYQKLDRDKLVILNHIIKEEEYYIDLLQRIKKSLSSS